MEGKWVYCRGGRIANLDDMREIEFFRNVANVVVAELPWVVVGHFRESVSTVVIAEYDTSSGAKSCLDAIMEVFRGELDVADLERLLSPRTKMLIINSPQNPTGGMLTRPDIDAIAELVKDKKTKYLS